MSKYILQTKGKGVEWTMEDQVHLLARSAKVAWEAWWPMHEALEKSGLPPEQVKDLQRSHAAMYQELQAMDIFMAGRHSQK